MLSEFLQYRDYLVRVNLWKVAKNLFQLPYLLLIISYLLLKKVPELASYILQVSVRNARREEVIAP